MPLPPVDLILLLRGAYLAAALAVSLVYLIPALRHRFLAYGPRASVSSSVAEPGEHDRTKPFSFSVVLDHLANIRVPHSWFTSFYALSVACSLIWLTQTLTNGSAFGIVVELVGPHQGSMTPTQIVITWAMLLLQASRRLHECLALQRPSNSHMWVGHWVLGIAFYLATSIAIWIEGIPTLQTHVFSIRDLAITPPGARTFFAVMIFILASGFQHDCHAYLGSLKARPAKENATRRSEPDYKIPEHPAFSSLIAPHYFAECLIYFALALIAAPRGHWMNWTLTCALVFVTVNLGVTADMTKTWYEKKFGAEAVRDKWRMIPFLF